MALVRKLPFSDEQLLACPLEPTFEHSLYDDRLPPFSTCHNRASAQMEREKDDIPPTKPNATGTRHTVPVGLLVDSVGAPPLWMGRQGLRLWIHCCVRLSKPNLKRVLGRWSWSTTYIASRNSTAGKRWSHEKDRWFGTRWWFCFCTYT